MDPLAHDPAERPASQPNSVEALATVLVSPEIIRR
jgi:hypothetical protein